MTEAIDQAHADAAPSLPHDAVAQDDSLQNLLASSEYQQRHSHIFKAKSAFEWFVRKHRDQLIEVGAMLFLTGQWWVHERRFDAFVLAVGKAAAAERRRLHESAQATS